MPSPDLSLFFDFVHAKSIEPADGHLKLVTFPDGFSCYTHTSVWETEYIYNEVCVKQEYLRHGLTLEGAPCVFDVGANIGMFTLFVKAKNPRAVVHAFEPIQDTYDVLRRNVELHRLTEVYTHNIALGSQTAAQRTFTYYPNMAGNTTATPAIKETLRQLMDTEGSKALMDQFFEAETEGGEALVEQFFEAETRIAPVRTLSSILDEQALPAIDFLKIDVEGDELAVLQGIAREHLTNIWQIVIEAHTPEITHKVCALLTGTGFKVVSDAGLASPAGISNVYAINEVIPKKRTHG
jgi:FkbM family methyltransferase